MHDLLVDEAALVDADRGPQFVTPVDHVHLLGELGQEERLLSGRVPAAHDGDRLVTVERAVARGAPGDAPPGELALAGHAQLLGHGAGREDDRAGAVLLAVGA